MPFLGLDQANTRHTLALIPVDSTGHLYNPTSVTFEIFDVGGSSVFGPEDVSSDNVDVGVFPLVLSGGADFVPITEGLSAGLYKVTWSFTEAPDDGSATRTWSQEFFVEAAGIEIPFWTYISPTQIRDEGISTTTLPDARMLKLIIRAQQYVERQCRTTFRPVAQQLRLDGQGGDSMFLAMAIIGIEFVRLNSSDGVLSPQTYRVYNHSALEEVPGWLPQDYRFNPKIGLRSITDITSIFGNTSGTLNPRFNRGKQNQIAKGVFGFVEADGSTPDLIRDAMLMLVVNTTTQITTGSSGGGPAGPIVRERTDRHEVEYGDPGAGAGLDSALATDPKVEEILAMYRAPFGIGAPANAALV